MNFVYSIQYLDFFVNKNDVIFLFFLSGRFSIYKNLDLLVMITGYLVLELN